MFGSDVSSVDHPSRWAIVCLIGFVVPALALANLRRSATGRRLLAMRTNERAAATLGVSVFRSKMYAFAVAGAIAALGGTLLGFRSTVVQYGTFNAFQSIYAVAYAVIGGVGYVVGSIIGSLMPVGGVGNQAFQSWFKLGSWTTLFGGVLLLVSVVAQPNGAALPLSEAWGKVRSKLVHRGPRVHRLPDAEPGRVEPATLRVGGSHGAVRGHRGRQRRQPRGRARAGRRSHRAERRRQDHVDRRRHRAGQEPRGARSASTARTSPAGARPVGRSTVFAARSSPSSSSRT